ncbi:MAG TPA: hypothetical protein VJZ71_03940 [Phycisphaerae bacterium]|nr:hypothetical protein [Phycisphaerae bacterium]
MTKCRKSIWMAMTTTAFSLAMLVQFPFDALGEEVANCTTPSLPGQISPETYPVPDTELVIIEGQLITRDIHLLMVPQ